MVVVASVEEGAPTPTTPAVDMDHRPSTTAPTPRSHAQHQLQHLATTTASANEPAGGSSSEFAPAAPSALQPEPASPLATRPYAGGSAPDSIPATDTRRAIVREGESCPSHAVSLPGSSVPSGSPAHTASPSSADEVPAIDLSRTRLQAGT